MDTSRPSRRGVLAGCAGLVTVPGCFAPEPEKLELAVPADADGAVTATVTLAALPSGERTFESTYTIEPAQRVSAGEFAEGADYRVEVAIGDAVRWRETVRANQFYVLELRPDGAVTVVGNGSYESTAESD